MAKEDAGDAKPPGQEQQSDQKSAAKTGSPGAADTSQQTSGSADAVALLKADHRAVEQMFQKFDKASDREKDDLAEQICLALTIHTALEEELFYPACRKAAKEEEPLDEAQVEHDAAKVLILDLRGGGGDDRFRDAKVRVLAEMVKHHVAEEEQANSGIMARAQKDGVDLAALGEQIKRRKQQLEQEGGPHDVRSVALTNTPRAQRPQYEESDMASNQGGRGRDMGGRYMEDDRRSGGRGDDRGGEGRGWHGDPRGHSEASRRGWEERDENRGRSRGYEEDDRGRSRSSGRYQDDDDGRGQGRGGWFGDPQGHSEASRRGWDNPDHGRSGWFGDSRGHADASRRGWDNPDHGPSGWFGDERGHSEASRRGWDNPDHGRSGWFGDPEGHSEASRRGWEERGSSRGGGGGRGRDDDDDGRGGRGRGGWFGDPEGHSQAARRRNDR